MTEFIIKAADWAIDYNGESLFKGCEEIVRCRDCVDFDRWDYTDGTTRNVCARFEFVDVTPDGFCAWGERRWTTCKCGESIELGDRESAVCPSCGRTVRE